MTKKILQSQLVNNSTPGFIKESNGSIKRTIKSVIDPELKINTKSELVYYINLPDNYDPIIEYPLIISIDGYGGHPASEYQTEKLRPYLSNKYECITVGVAYHGINRSSGIIETTPEAWDMIFNLQPGEFKKRFLAGKPMEKIMDGIFDFMVERNISRLSPLLAFKSSLPDQYSSFGFLPAIEHLNVIHDVISNFRIKLSDINIIGTSFGGYIALLMGKYAPHTFNIIIDNSGFVATQFSEIHPSLVAISSSYMRMIDGKRYEIPASTKSLWENNEFSDKYFSDAHKMIRNVTVKDHMIKSDTKYFSYHSQKDIIAPISEKEYCCKQLAKFAYVDFTKISSKDIDGQLFKTLEHGMNASLRKLYDITFEKYNLLNARHSPETDFHLESKHTFICLSRTYEFSYNVDNGLKVNITKLNDRSLIVNNAEITLDKNVPSREDLPIDVEKNNTLKNNTLTILPHSYKNEQFNENLTYFKKNQPALYNLAINHRCEEYKLCTNSDGSPNIIEVTSGNALYSKSSMAGIINDIRQMITDLKCNVRIPGNMISGYDEKWKINNPIQCKMLNDLYLSGIFSRFNLKNDFLTPLQKYNTDYFPLIRVLGIGLGYHLTELIKLKNISYLTIAEPHLDLFYTSLFTIPWQLIFKYFGMKGKGINLVIGSTPSDIVINNMAFIKSRLMPLTSSFYQYNHLSSPKIKEISEKEITTDVIEREQSDAGWYEDQVTGFYLSAKNIQSGNKYFSGKNPKSFFRAFIIGSGPSLNETIDYIKTHQNDAIIVSCGSALTPLLKAGIVPDYEVVQERLWQFVKLEEKHDLSLLKKITLLKLNVVSTRIDKHYKESLVFQKFRDPGSSLLDNKYPVTTAVNPTVTNAGISMCAALGVKEVYLFGVDYGAPQGSNKMHASNTIYDDPALDDRVESKTPLSLPGNFGSLIRTDTILSWSHHTTQLKISEYPNIQWYNVGEGAFIAGTKPLSIENLPERFSKKVRKTVLCSEISNCFDNNYSPTAVINKIKTTHMQQVGEYLQAISEFTNSTPQSREEIVSVLSLLYKAANIGQGQSSFLPASLLSYGFKQFITDVYIQISLEKNDDNATKYFDRTKGILTDYINNIRVDFSNVVGYLDKISEFDLIKEW